MKYENDKNIKIYRKFYLFRHMIWILWSKAPPLHFVHTHPISDTPHPLGLNLAAAYNWFCSGPKVFMSICENSKHSLISGLNSSFNVNRKYKKKVFLFYQDKKELFLIFLNIIFRPCKISGPQNKLFLKGENFPRFFNTISQEFETLLIYNKYFNFEGFKIRFWRIFRAFFYGFSLTPGPESLF